MGHDMTGPLISPLPLHLWSTLLAVQCPHHRPVYPAPASAKDRSDG